MEHLIIDLKELKCRQPYAYLTYFYFNLFISYFLTISKKRNSLFKTYVFPKYLIIFFC